MWARRPFDYFFLKLDGQQSFKDMAKGQLEIVQKIYDQEKFPLMKNQGKIEVMKGTERRKRVAFI
jgi:hypothetical protein